MSLASCTPHLDFFEEVRVDLVAFLSLDKKELGSMLEIGSRSVQ